MQVSDSAGGTAKPPSLSATAPSLTELPAARPPVIVQSPAGSDFPALTAIFVPSTSNVPPIEPVTLGPGQPTWSCTARPETSTLLDPGRRQRPGTVRLDVDLDLSDRVTSRVEGDRQVLERDRQRGREAGGEVRPT